MNLILFLLNSILLGVGLAMDAFSVSMANGLNEPHMPRRKSLLIAGTFALFQFLMPMIGWTCVHTIVEYFSSFQKFIPWIALILLGIIGGNMIFDGIHGDPDSEKPGVGMRALLLQGIATSIDALSVGFTIADYSIGAALLCSILIAAVTMVICTGGLKLGKKFGMKLAGKASILGGCILIGIGIEIFVSNLL